MGTLIDTNTYDKTIVEAALEFVESSLLASPQRGFAHLFKRDNLEAKPELKESFTKSVAEFANDLGRWNWRFENPRELFEQLVLAPNLVTVYFYRLSHALFVREIKLYPDVIAALAKWMTGVEIYYSAKIGPGLKVVHGLGTVIGAQSRIGSHFSVYQGVTIGDKIAKQTGLDQRPEIGNYVIVCAGAVILGPIRIGDKTIIGANSVVLNSLPDRCIAVGSPAEIKQENISDEEFQAMWTAIKGYNSK